MVDHCVHADHCGGGVGVVVIVGVGPFVIGGVVTGGFVTGRFVTGGFVVVVLVLFEAELLLMSAVFSFEDSCRPSLVVAAT